MSLSITEYPHEDMRGRIARAADEGGLDAVWVAAPSASGSASAPATTQRFGTGERRTLPLVARYADACNVFDIPDGGETIRRKLDVLREHCEAIGRPYEEIEEQVAVLSDSI